MKVAIVEEWRADIKVAIVEEYRAQMLVAEVEEYRADRKVTIVEEYRADLKVALVEEYRAGSSPSTGYVGSSVGYGGYSGATSLRKQPRVFTETVMVALIGGFFVAIAIAGGASFWTYDQTGTSGLVLAGIVWLGTVIAAAAVSIGATTSKREDMAGAGIGGAIAGALVTVGRLFGTYEKGGVDTWMPVWAWVAPSLGFVIAALAVRLLPEGKAAHRAFMAVLFLAIGLAAYSVWFGWNDNYSQYTG